MSVLVAESRAPVAQVSRPPIPTEEAWSGRGEMRLAFPGRPEGLVVGPDGTVFVSDTASASIRRIVDGIEAAPFGVGLGRPAGLALAPDGSLLVAETSGHRVLALSAQGRPRVVAGNTGGWRDGRGDEALFRYPSDVAIGPDGTMFVADAGNHRIRTISAEGVVATLAGSIYDYGDGRGSNGRFRQPLALDVDAAGTCYVADTGNNAIRRVAPNGEVTTVVGSPPGGKSDGAGAEVGLHTPTGIAVGQDGALWVVDHGNGVVRRIERSGASTTRLRLSGRRWPVAVACGSDGKVMVAAMSLEDPRRPEARLIMLEMEP